MTMFPEQSKNDRLATLQALGNRDLFRRWLSVGVRLFDELPNDFNIAFDACLARFPDAPPEVRERTVENWEILGSKLIAATDASRRMTCAIIVESTAALEEALQDRPHERVNDDAREAAPEANALTFSRLARIAELIVEEADEYVGDDPDADCFFIELDDGAARELEQLHNVQPQLVVVALAMSLTEWSMAHPKVDLVQVRFAEKTLDVRVAKN